MSRRLALFFEESSDIFRDFKCLRYHCSIELLLILLGQTPNWFLTWALFVGGILNCEDNILLKLTEGRSKNFSPFLASCMKPRIIPSDIHKNAIEGWWSRSINLIPSGFPGVTRGNQNPKVIRHPIEQYFEKNEANGQNSWVVQIGGDVVARAGDIGLVENPRKVNRGTSQQWCPSSPKSSGVCLCFIWPLTLRTISSVAPIMEWPISMWATPWLTVVSWFFYSCKITPAAILGFLAVRTWGLGTCGRGSGQHEHISKTHQEPSSSWRLYKNTKMEEECASISYQGVQKWEEYEIYCSLHCML